MTSSSEAHAVRADASATVTPLRTPDLRYGAWTRLGDSRVLGDAPAETVFDQLAERAWTAARSQGYAVGYSDGRRKAASVAAAASRAAAATRAEDDARRESEYQSALAALSTATQRILDLAAQTCTTLEEQASGLAAVITEELIGHELRDDTTEDVVRRVLRVLPHSDLSAAVVRLHPATIDCVGGAASLEQLTAAGVRLLSDASLGRHDAVVELTDRVLRLDIAGALHRVREVLA